MSATQNKPQILWEHPDPQGTEMFKFMQESNKRYGLQLKTFSQLYKWSCNHRSQFYAQLLDYAKLIYTGSYSIVVDEAAPIDSIPRWFQGVRINWAENILYSRSSLDPFNFHGLVGKENDKIAITEVREAGDSIREVSWAQFRQQSGNIASALHARGIRNGDRIVVVGANSIETCLIFIACTWLGAIFSSCSTDMGVDGILQRTRQIDPKLIFFDDAALYNGKVIDMRKKMTEVSQQMQDCSQFECIISIPRFQQPRDVSSVLGTETWASFVSGGASNAPPFYQCAFDDPFLIVFSSGTTGTPKAIVHGVGNTILALIKEGRLHQSIDKDSVGLQFTTTSWIMYLANVGQLLSGARAVMYDGSPFYPDRTTFIKIMSDQRITKLGTSPRWMQEMVNNGINPREVADLSSLKVVTTTGMVLSEQLSEWFYRSGFPKHVHLANISGGTDIAGCFAQENPLTPVYGSGIQGPSLGVPIAMYNSDSPSDSPKICPPGSPGELVATAAFPNMPVFFWGDDNTHRANSGPETNAWLTASPGSKYHGAYFDRFDHVWAHGDFCVVDSSTGNISFLGRADGVLNPSGVRFGSAEIYKVMERRFADRVSDSLCVGQRRPTDEDESVMLFLLMKPGHSLDRALSAEIRNAIQQDLTKRHVPKWIFQTPEIPTTVNGKKVELPVKRIVSGYKVKPSGTLLNPRSLDFYYQFAQVENFSMKGKL